MTGRLLAICGWLAWKLGRMFRVTRGDPNVPALVLAGVLLLAALAPLVIPLFDGQPEEVTVEDIIARQVTDPNGWVRVPTWVLIPLDDAPNDAPGEYGLLVDASDRLQAIAVRSEEPIQQIGPPPEGQDAAVALTGHVAEMSAVVDEEELPLDATVFGTPPVAASDRMIELDPVPKAERVILWPLSILPALLAGVLLVGARLGYPVFRPTTDVDVLTAPLGPGERLPAAYGGHIGPNARDLADPGGALLLVRRGPKGNLLTAQPLADEGGLAPAPVTIGGSWTSGRVGHVYSLSETIPALIIRSEQVDATFLFARLAERDRVASLIAVER